MSKKIIFFSPHPDDVCLGCGGTISKKVKSGEIVFIVNLTDGCNCFSHLFGIENNPNPKEISIVRKNEEINAIATLGVPKENIIFLDFEDSQLYKNQTSAEKKIDEILKMIHPSEIFIPSIKDHHLDHIFTNILVKRIIIENHFKLKIFEYFIWGKPNLPENSLINNNILDEIKTKKNAIQFYKSQITIFSPKQKKPILDEKFLTNFYSNGEQFEIVKLNNLKDRFIFKIQTLKMSLNLSLLKLRSFSK